MTDYLQAILSELHQKFLTLYGPRLERLVLYGSQARHEAHPGSDIDVLVVLRGDVRLGEEIRRVVPITADLSLQNNVLISCAFTTTEQYERDEEPLLMNIRREGITL